MDIYDVVVNPVVTEGRVSSVQLRCPHCYSNLLLDPDPSRIFRDGAARYSLLRCLNCRGMFTSPTPAAERLSRYYADASSEIQRKQYLPARLLDAMHRLRQYKQQGYIAGKRLLDYGLGAGCVARVASRLGYEADALDPVAQGGAAASSAEADRYSTVIANHTLQCAMDPDAFIDQMLARLESGGRLIVTVPNANSVAYRQRGVLWSWARVPFLHLHHYTEAGLRALLERHGLEIEAVQFYERWEASSLADLKLASLFTKLEGWVESSTMRWASTQLASLLRYAAFAGTYVWPNPQGADRSELLVVARR